MSEVILGAVWSFLSILFCFLFFLSGSYIGMFAMAFSLAFGLFLVGSGLRKNSSSEEENEKGEEEGNTEECYGVLQYYTSSTYAEILVYVPSLNRTMMISKECVSEDGPFAVGTCFSITMSNSQFEIEEVISYSDIPEESRSLLVVYPNPNSEVLEGPTIYSSLEQNS